MYKIETHPMSPAFYECWKAAGNHLNNKSSGAIQWLRAHPYPPFLEHLSFRLGNQLFFIYVEDNDGIVHTSSNLENVITFAKSNRGHACILPMKKNGMGTWEAMVPQWGLVDPETEVLVDPLSLVTDEQIEMTDWEVHDMAIQVVRDDLVANGFEITSMHSAIHVDPSIWFIGKSQEVEWVVVRGVRYPAKGAVKPENFDDIASHCAALSDVGHFASVALANTKQDYTSRRAPVLPLWRGGPMHIQYSGLGS